jgi:cytochrome c biogenesis protein
MAWSQRVPPVRRQGPRLKRPRPWPRSDPIANRAAAWEAPAASSRPDPLTRLGFAVWRLLTSVNFAVVQIIILSLFAVVGMTIRQLPGFAFRSAGDYAGAMADIHDRYDQAFGRSVVDVMERLQLFHVFTSTWVTVLLLVLVVSIVVCTLDRTPRLWRQSAEIRVVQPDPFYTPSLPDRAAMSGVTADAVRATLRRHRFKVREAESDGFTHLYGDRNQYTKMATLLNHLGLILFLLAGVVTSAFGDEQGLIVTEGDSLTVQPIGTPGLLLVKNLGFEAPGFFETGQATDFTTDLAVYQDGREIARKTIRVNDPLAAGGYTFHQNGFGPAVDLLISDAEGRPLWDGPVPLDDQAAGRPYGTVSVPGREGMGLQLLLERESDGTGVVLVLPYRVVGEESDGSPIVEDLFPMALAAREASPARGTDFSVGVLGFGEYTLLIAKKDPGQGIVWTAFGLLITGLVITFYLPRRRIWARLSPSGDLAIVNRSDRYVDVEREFGRLLDDLVAARRPA